MRVRSSGSRGHPPIQRSAIAFMRGVRTLQSTVRIPGTGEDRVRRGRVVRATVADHELDPLRLFAEVHDQVAGLLGGPFSGGRVFRVGDKVTQLRERLRQKAWRASSTAQWASSPLGADLGMHRVPPPPGYSRGIGQTVLLGAVVTMAADPDDCPGPRCLGRRDRLRRRDPRPAGPRFAVIGFANPLRDLARDAAYLAEFLRTLTGPIVLVGHSYGGNVISTAARQRPGPGTCLLQRLDVRRGREPAAAP